MFVRLIFCLISFAAGTTFSANSKSFVDRLRYLSEQVASLLPASPACQSEPLKPEDRQSIIDAMVLFVQDDKSELESFISVLSNARRCGLTSAEIDTYKWDVISALMASPRSEPIIAAEPSEAKKRTIAEEEEGSEEASNKKSRYNEKSAEEIKEVKVAELQETTLEPTIVKRVPNISARSERLLIDDLWSYVGKFDPMQLRDTKWGYLRATQGLRAASLDYAAIREDLNLLIDMRIEAKEIANVFTLALSVMERGLYAPIKKPSLPKNVESEFQRPLKERLESLYNHPDYRWSRDNRSALSLRLAEYVKEGKLDHVTYALNLARMAMVPRIDTADIFYKAYQALGGKY